jgi:hypothetical protein
MQREGAAIAGRPATTRSRTSNDPRHVPGLDGRKTEQRRRRDLVAIYIDALGGRAAATELQLVEVRKAAELTAAAEVVRARVLAGASIDLSSLVKLEGEARRAVRALGIKSGPPPHVPLRDRLAAEAESAGEAA